MTQIHRVETKRHPSGGLKLPVDHWKGGTFVEADGTVLEVKWDGHKGSLDQTVVIERGTQRCRKDGHPVAFVV